jgi:hypothetical protein
MRKIIRTLTLALGVALSLTPVTLIVLAQPAYSFDRILDQQLYTAAENGTGWLVKVLMLVGANPNAKHITEGTTPLMGAAGAGQTEIVKMMLDKGADPKIGDKNGATALTIGYHHLDIVKLLVEKGADVNAQPVMGGRKQLTALMSATNDGDKETVAFLLEHGADPTMKTSSEKGALDLAEQHKFPEISKMLSDMIAKKTGAQPGAAPDAAAAAAAAGGAAPGTPGAAPAAAPGAVAAAAPAAAAPAAAAPAAPAAPAPASTH